VNAADNGRWSASSIFARLSWVYAIASAVHVAGNLDMLPPRAVRRGEGSARRCGIPPFAGQARRCRERYIVLKEMAFCKYGRCKMLRIAGALLREYQEPALRASLAAKRAPGCTTIVLQPLLQPG